MTATHATRIRDAEDHRSVTVICQCGWESHLGHDGTKDARGIARSLLLAEAEHHLMSEAV